MAFGHGDFVAPADFVGAVPFSGLRPDSLRSSSAPDLRERMLRARLTP